MIPGSLQGHVHRAVRVASGGLGLLVALTLCSCTGHKNSHGEGTAGVTSSSAGTPTAPPLTAGRATVIQTALQSSDNNQIAAVLAPSVRRTYLSAPSRLWPAGCHVVIDESKFKPHGTTMATVPAAVTGTQPGRFTVLLAYTDGVWDVLATHEDA